LRAPEHAGRVVDMGLRSSKRQCWLAGAASLRATALWVALEPPAGAFAKNTTAAACCP
jgi:hypothetical protein